MSVQDSSVPVQDAHLMRIPKTYIQHTLERLRMYDEKLTTGTENLLHNITEEERKILANRIISAGAEIQASEDTIFHAVRLFDRLLCLDLVEKENANLYAAISLMLPFKMNEPKLTSLCEKLSSLFENVDLQRLVEAETAVMDKLCFDIFIPTPIAFLHTISPILLQAVGESNTHKKMLVASALLCQAALESSKFSSFSAEEITKAALAITCKSAKVDTEKVLTEVFGSAPAEKCVEFVNESLKLPDNSPIEQKFNDVFK